MDRRDKDRRFAVPFSTPRTGSRAAGGRVSVTDASPVVGAPIQSAIAEPAEAPLDPTITARPARSTGERRKGRRRSRTIPMRQLTRDELIQGAELTDIFEYDRPRSRADCLDMPRPCPFVSCRHHLYLEVNEDTGSIKLNFPDMDLEELPETCALDVADRGGVTLEEIGEILNLTRERIRQVEAKGLERLREASINEDPTTNTAA